MNHASKRIEWIDIAKGIAIMLVVIAHTIGFGDTGPVLKTIIYSFHMPFFFIMSGITSSLPSSMDELWKKTKALALSLVIPAYVAYFFKEIIKLILYNNTDLPPNYFMNQFYSLLYIDNGETTFLQFNTYSIGSVWFIFVLFLCRTLLGYLNLIFNKQQLLFVVGLLSLIGYIASRQFHMIFAFDIVLTALPFCLFGHYMKNKNMMKYPFRYGTSCLFFWIISFILFDPNPKDHLHFSFFSRSYPFYPLCFFTAIAGTIFFCCCCILFSKLRVSKFFSFVGKHTLIYLLIHYFDFIWKPLWDFPSDQYIKTLLRLLTNTIVFLVIMLLKYTFKKAKIYFTKTPKEV